MILMNVGTYPPRECGIASFSKDLRDSVIRTGQSVWITALTDEKKYAYPKEVRFSIQQNDTEDYLRAAYMINNSAVDLVILQHEYGIFGGSDGALVIKFAAHLKKPFILVTHTVLPRPSPGQRIVLQILSRRAAAVICMTERSKELLEKVYGVPEEKITVIPHGVPVFERKDRDALKRSYGFAGRKVITTFGLIGPSKGLEIGIKAVKELVGKHPEILYIIAGKTHPVLQKREGERYREMLIKLCADLQIEQNVRFVDHYLDIGELGDYLYMSDVYLSPYPNRDQAVSGTLAYAVGCGRAVVATPYEYSLELLKEKELGLVAAEASAEGLGKLLDQLLSRPLLRKNLERRASRFGETIKWPSVAARYVELAQTVLAYPVVKQQQVVGNWAKGEGK
ncbi:MAG: glycosyltransferase family 4 protein [Thermacetogeniaceae bacterium]|nr:glycosyltransferase family 4 protein [Thermoanaerobacterales bacterium]HAF16736.1 glycosyl transferase family 1 [Peptococcaceae bacterium]